MVVGRVDAGGRSEDGVRACTKSLEASEMRLSQEPQRAGQGEMGSKGGGGARPPWVRGSRDQRSEQRQRVSRLPEQAPQSPTPPLVTAHGPK